MDQQPEDSRAIMTVLEGHVAPDQWATLVQSYHAAGERLPPQMLQSQLLQCTGEPTLWQVIAIWRNRAALDEYRRAAGTPGGVLMFRAAGTEPHLRILEVIADRHH